VDQKKGPPPFFFFRIRSIAFRNSMAKRGVELDPISAGDAAGVWRVWEFGVLAIGN